MKCDDCGNEMKSPAFYKCHDKKLGDLQVKTKKDEYHVCDKCGNERIRYSLMKRIEEKENNQ